MGGDLRTGSNRDLIRAQSGGFPGGGGGAAYGRSTTAETGYTASGTGGDGLIVIERLAA